MQAACAGARAAWWETWGAVAGRLSGASLGRQEGRAYIGTGAYFIAAAVIHG